MKTLINARDRYRSVVIFRDSGMNIIRIGISVSSDENCWTIVDIVSHLYLLFLSRWLPTCLSCFIFKRHFENDKITCNQAPKRTRPIWCLLCSPSAILFLFPCCKILIFFSVRHFFNLYPEMRSVVSGNIT